MSIQTSVPTVPDSAWFKSSYSGGEGGECVEVAAVRESAWTKSSHSSGEGGECVEVAAVPDSVYVRDSKVPSGPVLSVGPAAWAGFVGMAVGETV